jgi:hypothetical protein
MDLRYHPQIVIPSEVEGSAVREAIPWVFGESATTNGAESGSPASFACWGENRGPRQAVFAGVSRRVCLDGKSLASSTPEGYACCHLCSRP